MTGWQGNEGNQGGWNQPPNPYGGDPYGPQGTHPYAPDPNQYQADPYAQPNPYGQGGYDQYGQYNPYQTGGFPAQDFGPPPPPRRSKLPMILGVLAIVIIVGAVVAIVLVNRDDSPTAGPSDTTAPSTPESPGKSSDNPPSSDPSGPSKGPEGKEGWQVVDNTADAGLSYEVPGDWELSPDPRPSGLGDVTFTGSADYGVYDCEGGSYIRSFAASGDVQGKDGAKLDLTKTVKDFAKSFGTSYFKDTAKVDVPEPTETEVDGKQAMTLNAAVTPQVTAPKCEASKGEVAIVGVLLEEDGKPSGVAMLAVVSDVSGGPGDPAPLPPSVAKDILASVKVG
ncbi:MAG: hypothetical protein GEV28_34430 [Actinophytocola sp.]|uniref:hypothetical protein n=1 Tax=Actinophytocola sp. TaxID=1872138 RepID=UPI00132C04C7|nr:hypothetical protein [Actinophytocola sp.]MPZ85213.1 hypothetical protein [Actinophytocola sp.]